MIDDVDPWRRFGLDEAADSWMALGQGLLHQHVRPVNKSARDGLRVEQKDLASRRERLRRDCFHGGIDEGAILAARKFRPVPSQRSCARRERNHDGDGDR